MDTNKNLHKKKLVKVLTSAFIAATVSTTPFVANTTDAAANFKDVPSGAFYEKAVYELAEKGVIGGYNDGTFLPNKAVTRAEAAKMLAFDLGLTDSDQPSTNFTDVKKENWFFQPVSALSQAGGISGYENRTFQPNKTITRAELASMLVKAYSLKAPTTSTQLTFKDVAPRSWYVDAVQILLENKITSGKSATQFAPNDIVTRGEIAAFISKVNASNKIDKPVIIPNMIEKIAGDNSITIAGKTYKAATNLSGILNSKNSAVLQNAKLEFKENNGTITDITYLQLNSNGQASEQEFSKNAVLDGIGNTINGKLEVNANYVTIKNVTVNGDLEITSNLKNDFYSEKLTVKGQTIVKGGDDNTVVFKDASLGVVTINKKDVRVEPKGNTSVQEININSNAHIAVDDSASISKTIINNGANYVQFDGQFGTVEVKNYQSTILKGNATIKELQVKQNTNISIEINNKITKVTAEKGGILSIGINTAVSNLQLPTGIKATDIVSNYESIKNNIEKTNSESNPDFKVPAIGGGGGGGGGISSGADTIINKYKSELDGLKDTAKQDFTKLLTDYLTGNISKEVAKQKGNEKFDGYKASFDSSYGKLVNELKENGYSEEKAKVIQDEFNKMIDPYKGYLE